MIASDIAKNEESYILMTSGRYVLTGHDSPYQTMQKDFEVREGRSPWCLCWFLGLKAYIFQFICVAHVSALPNGWEEEACWPAAGIRSNYSGIFYFSRTWVPAVWRILLVGMWQSTLLHVAHRFEVWLERPGSICLLGELSSGKEACNSPREKEEEQIVGGAIRNNKNDTYD